MPRFATRDQFNASRAPLSQPVDRPGDPVTFGGGPFPGGSIGDPSARRVPAPMAPGLGTAWTPDSVGGLAPGPGSQAREQLGAGLQGLIGQLRGAQPGGSGLLGGPGRFADPVGSVAGPMARPSSAPSPAELWASTDGDNSAAMRAQSLTPARRAPQGADALGTARAARNARLDTGRGQPPAPPLGVFSDPAPGGGLQGLMAGVGPRKQARLGWT